jgi:hypothetical protein
MKMTWRVGVLALAMTAAACNSGAPTAAPDMTGITPWTQVAEADLNVPNGVIYSMTAVQGVDVAQIGGVPEAASPAARTGGVSVKLPDAFESEASGARVQIMVRASAAEDGAMLGVAYSTNDVGNSGWQRFRLTTQPRDYVFAYNVSELHAGNGDYLGFRSFGEQTVFVWGYDIQIVPDTSASELRE